MAGTERGARRQGPVTQALLQEFGVYSQINLLRGSLKGGEQGDGEIGI